MFDDHDDHPRPRRALISSLAGGSRRRLECGGAPTRELEHARRELISTITPCSSPPAEEDQCCQQGCPTHRTCESAPLGSHDIAPLPGGQHLTERRHRPHNKRRPAQCAVHRKSRRMPPPRHREGVSHRAESEAGPRSQLVKGETDMTYLQLLGLLWKCHSTSRVSRHKPRPPNSNVPAGCRDVSPAAAAHRWRRGCGGGGRGAGADNSGYAGGKHRAVVAVANEVDVVACSRERPHRR